MLEMKIEGTETPNNPHGFIVNKEKALRFALKNMPVDMKKAGWIASVFPGARGWAINYSAICKTSNMRYQND